MRHLFISIFIIIIATSCFNSGDFKKEGKQNKPGITARFPCEENKEASIKYNMLVDSLQQSFSFDKSFEELELSIGYADKIKVIQNESDCLIRQSGKIAAIKSKCLELKLSAETLNKTFLDEDLKNRISFYNQMITLLNE